MKSQILTFNLAKLIFYLFLGVCILFFSIDIVQAHRVNLFAYVEGDTVHVESKFSGGKRVNAGKIIVLDALGTKLITGITDENGAFSFKVPKKTELKIVLEASTGHRAEWTIAASEIQMPASGKKPEPEKDTTFTNMFIGLGFIFGLTAIIAYMRNRRKKNVDPENSKI